MAELRERRVFHGVGCCLVIGQDGTFIAWDGAPPTLRGAARRDFEIAFNAWIEDAQRRYSEMQS